jgi:glycosyltransferase involved in cell wall biosynthesis
MDSRYLLTIVTITFQAERFIERTLDSVKQALAGLDYPSDIEYLIVDGASKDATLSIVQRYGDLVTSVISEPDRGIYDAMNKGLRAAKGKYIWFLNAGDSIFDSEVLRQLLPHLRTSPDILYSDAMIVRENGTDFGLRSEVTPHRLPEKLSWKDFALGMKVCHQAFIVKKSIAPSYDNANLSADIDWEIACLKSAKSVHKLSFVLCRYLMGGASIQNHKRSLTDRFGVLRKHFGLGATLFNHVIILSRGFIFRLRKGKYW